MNKRLSITTLNAYLKSEYGQCGQLLRYKTISDIKSFLQKDFGKDNDKDCSLVSILTIVKYYLYKLKPEFLYNEIKKVAKKYLYINSLGLLPIFNKTIIKQVLQDNGLIYFPIHANYIKNVGFTFDTIVSIINKNKPILLSLWSDGRDYYKKHSVVIVGYELYDNAKLLKIYDN